MSSECSMARTRIPRVSKTRYQPCADCDVETCRVRHLMLDVRNAGGAP